MIALAILLPLGDATGFGRSLALVGDLDLDRCCEVAVGSPSDGEGHRGKAFLFSGKTGTLLRELVGPGEGSGFGTDLAAAGDQDGDGVVDLAVGAPHFRGERSEGRVDLFSGKDGRLLRSISPAEGERYFGTSLAAIGDVDGDGKEDLLVRMRAGSGKDEHERFAAISLGTGRRLYAVDAPPGVTSHDLGRPLAPLPDVDGDRIPDFAVEHGSDVHMHSGAGGKEIAKLGSTVPAVEKSAFGFSLCAIPGRPTLVAVGDPVEEEGRGAVSVMPVPAPGEERREGAGAVLPGDEEFRGVGRSLALAGDLDGDGIPDLAVGWCDGRLGGVALFSSRDLSPSRAIEDEPAPEAGDAHVQRLPLGWRVEAGRDVDGDGKPDVAVARYWPTAPAGLARSVVIYSGSDGRKVRELVSPAAPSKSETERK